jgi:polyferredoxin
MSLKLKGNSNADNDLYRPQTAIDVLSLPGLGRLLRWRWGRLTLQVPLALIALLLIYDGFTGSQIASRNLATVAPWVHYRGLVVIALLLAGNLFCMGCPFTLPRTLAKGLSLRGRRFPKILRNKWLAIGALFLLFFLYEWLDLWASPALTAWVIVFYFVASFVLEAVFSESAFCKYVCPLGTFNFVYATAAPTQIRAKNLTTCASCVGKECINGSYSAQPVILIDQIGGDGQPEKTHEHNPQGTLGCGTLLFAPQIKSNLDCTLCLDCVRACPHDNIALSLRPPGAELTQPDAWRKSWDVSALAIILAFMGITNAFGMVPPVYDLIEGLANTLGLSNAGKTGEAIVLLILFAVGNLLLPAGLTLAAGWLSRTVTNTARKYTLREIVAEFAPAFVPLGLGIWIAHYGFHFLLGAGTIIPVFQEFLLDHGITLFGATANWNLAQGADTGLIGLVQIVALLGGFLWSLYIAQRAALRLYKRQGVIGLLPWALLFLGMTYMALQIFSLPMEMRGMESLFN